MTKQKNIIIMMLAFLTLLPVGSTAQEVVQKLDSLQILIGEQTKLHLKVTAGARTEDSTHSIGRDCPVRPWGDRTGWDEPYPQAP